MKSIITVLGKDHMGIIGSVCTYLAENKVNILDISQTILDGYFSMMMVVDISATEKEFDVLADELNVLGENNKVDIKIQHAQIFDSMHRI